MAINEVFFLKHVQCTVYRNTADVDIKQGMISEPTPCTNCQTNRVEPGNRVPMMGVYRAVPHRFNPKIHSLLSVYKTHIYVLHFRKTDSDRLHTTNPTALIDDETVATLNDLPNLQSQEAHEAVKDLAADLINITNATDMLDTVIKAEGDRRSPSLPPEGESQALEGGARFQVTPKPRDLAFCSV